MHQDTVVLEEIRAQNKVFGEEQQLLREQVDSLQKEMNARFKTVDRRFEEVHQTFRQVNRDIGLLKDAALENRRELSGLRTELQEHRSP